MSLSAAWEEHAREWITWARAQGHDGFWNGTWPALRALLPEPGGLIVEIGCGEGRAGREMVALGHDVVGVERSRTLVAAARDADPPLAVVHGDSARLPFGDETATAVVACMSLIDVDDLDATITEAARVLRPGGRLCVALVHPFLSAYDMAGPRDREPTLSTPYLQERRYVDRVERDGLGMTFESMHRPLSTYVAAWSRAGLTLDELRESGDGDIPWLLVARAGKPLKGGGSAAV